jgi:hypothetical protein
MQKMSAYGYAEKLFNEYAFDDLIQEQHLLDAFDADSYLRVMLDKASQYSILLSNFADFDYEAFFTDCYQCSEKLI